MAKYSLAKRVDPIVANTSKAHCSGMLGKMDLYKVCTEATKEIFSQIKVTSLFAMTEKPLRKFVLVIILSWGSMCFAMKTLACVEDLFTQIEHFTRSIHLLPAWPIDINFPADLPLSCNVPQYSGKLIAFRWLSQNVNCFGKLKAPQPGLPLLTRSLTRSPFPASECPEHHKANAKSDALLGSIDQESRPMLSIFWRHRRALQGFVTQVSDLCELCRKRGKSFRSARSYWREMCLLLPFWG